jgi:dihydropteroate synthase
MITLNLNGHFFSKQMPIIMGILNVTPDSFYEKSRLNNFDALLQKTEKMLKDGVDFLDIGGYSTRPNAENITLEEEKRRVLPAIEIILKEFPDANISIDTFRTEVAKEAVKIGAKLVNDISGGQLDENMLEEIPKLNVPYILMHSKGTPQTMTELTDYQNILIEMLDYFQQKIKILREKGQKDIIIDMGFGFAKTIEQNFFLLKNLSIFKILDCPILVGISRKSMIYKTLQITPEEALNGTTILNLLALQNGANILRVHDVKEAQETILLWEKYKKS